jgi:hypothetical protein
MAHATDYQSRLPSNWDHYAVVRGLLFKLFSETNTWTERAIEEYCINAYEHMGVNAVSYKLTRQSWLERNLKS